MPASTSTEQLPQILYIQTVVSKNAAGKLVMRGLYISDDNQAFELGAALSLQVNFLMMDREIKKAVVFLDPHEFKSTWLGNKSVYRTRMALADDSELIVLAPGVHEFGEDEHDRQADPQVWLLRHAGHARSREAGPRTRRQLCPLPRT